MARPAAVDHLHHLGAGLAKVAGHDALDHAGVGEVLHAAVPELPMAPQAQVLSARGWPVARKWFSSAVRISSGRLVTASRPGRWWPCRDQAPTSAAWMTFMGVAVEKKVEGSAGVSDADDGGQAGVARRAAGEEPDTTATQHQLLDQLDHATQPGGRLGWPQMMELP